MASMSKGAKPAHPIGTHTVHGATVVSRESVYVRLVWNSQYLLPGS